MAKRYRCKYCPASFNTDEELMAHEDYVHAAEVIAAEVAEMEDEEQEEQ